MSATVKASIDDLAAFAARTSDLDDGAERRLGTLDDALLTYRFTCTDVPRWPACPSGAIEALLRRCRALAEGFEHAAARLAEAGSAGGVPGAEHLDGWAHALARPTMQFSSTPRRALPLTGLAAALAAREAAQQYGDAARALLHNLFGARPLPTVVSRTVETYGAEVGVTFFGGRFEVLVVRETLSDGTARIYVVDGRGASLEASTGAGCEAQVNGTDVLNESALASASVGVIARHGNVFLFGSPAEADRWWDDNSWAERAKAVNRAGRGPGDVPGVDRIANWLLGGDGRDPDGVMVQISVEGAAGASRSLRLGDASEVAAAAVNAAARASVTTYANRSADVTTQVSVSAAALADGPLVRAGAGAGVDTTTQLHYGPDGTPRSLTVTTVELDEPNKKPSVNGGGYAYGTAGDAGPAHTYVVEVTVDLGDPAAAGALARATGVAVDDPAAASLAALKGSVYDRAVLALSDVTVTEFAPPTVTGAAASCDLAALVEASAGVTAQSSTQLATARYTKAAGTDVFVAQDVATTRQGAPARAGGGGGGW